MIKLRDLASPSRIFLKVKLGATTTNLLHFILVKIVSGISIVVFVADVAAGLGLLSRQLRVKPLHGLKNLAENFFFIKNRIPQKLLKKYSSCDLATLFGLFRFFDMFFNIPFVCCF